MQQLLRHMGADVELAIKERDGRTVLSVKGPDEGMIIGHRGETLNSLQMLLTMMLRRKIEVPAPFDIVIDVDDYLVRREKQLRAMAIRMAEEAVEDGRPVSIKPMNARDRRVIHVSLRDFPGVHTRSEGDGDMRYVKIFPGKDTAPESEGEQDEVE
jgi:spoIIIJ-associated protein